MATACLSAAALQGWEDGNSVTLKEADGIDLPPSPQGGSREIYKRRASPVKVTSLPCKTSGAFQASSNKSNPTPSPAPPEDECPIHSPFTLKEAQCMVPVNKAVESEAVTPPEANQ